MEFLSLRQITGFHTSNAYSFLSGLFQTYYQVIDRIRILILVISLLLVGAKADQPADQLLGRWQFPAGGSSVDIYRQAGRYFARVAQVDQAGKQNFGLVKDSLLIRNLRYDGQLWAGGHLIHPKTGIALRVEVKLLQLNTINVTVYKGFKFLNRQFIMTRQETE